MIISDNNYFFDYDSESDISKLDEWIISEQKKAYREKFEEKHNIKRDKQGRLNKGALLAQKDCCDNDAIWLRVEAGMTVREIVDCMGCSKSTVYNVIKKHKEKEK